MRPPPTLHPDQREAFARAEMDATRIGRRTAGWLTGLFLALLATGPLVELPAAFGGRSELLRPLPQTDGTPGLRGFVDRWRLRFAEVEDRFDDRSVLVHAVRPHVQQFLTRGLGYGNQPAIVAPSGWLYFRDDLDHLLRRGAAASAAEAVEAVVAFDRALAARGVRLLVVPAPLKPTAHPERLAADAVGPVRRFGELALLDRLRNAGVEVVDLAPRFARDASLTPLYLATDTHWRPEAVEIAAAEIALRLRELAELPPGRDLHASAAVASIEGRGDTARLLGLADDSILPRDRVEVRRAGVDPAERRGAPVLLLGDSFSAIYSSAELGWGAGGGLADRLEARLGFPVDRILRNAGGASETREALAQAWTADPPRFADLRAVVWELAAREWSQGRWSEVSLPPP